MLYVRPYLLRFTPSFSYPQSDFRLNPAVEYFDHGIATIFDDRHKHWQYPYSSTIHLIFINQMVRQPIVIVSRIIFFN